MANKTSPSGEVGITLHVHEVSPLSGPLHSIYNLPCKVLPISDFSLSLRSYPGAECLGRCLLWLTAGKANQIFSCIRHSVETPIWFAWWQSSAGLVSTSVGRMTFCLFAASTREVLLPSKEMQPLLKAYATQSFIFVTLLTYLRALNWCDAHWRHPLDSTLSLMGCTYLRFWRYFFSKTVFLCHCLLQFFFILWWHNDSFPPGSLHEQLALVSRIAATSNHCQSCFSNCYKHNNA